MRICYALFERPTNGYRWTWHAEELKDSLLDDFYYRIKDQIPNDGGTIRPEHLRGGIVKMSQVYGSKVDEHVVLYRFFDGGVDDEGRPGRVAMLAAWTTTDQFPSPSSAQSILGLFRNPMFEHVSANARKGNIERPYSLIGKESLAATVGAPSAPLAEFARGMADEDHDYSLTIQNENHAVRKTPSVTFKYKETEAARRKQEDEQRKADQVKREAQEAKRRADERKREAEEAAPVAKKPNDKGNGLAKEERSQEQSRANSGLLMLIVMMVGVIALCAILFLFIIWSNSGNSQNLSDAAEKVVEGFMVIQPEEQKQVLAKLKDIVKNQSRSRSNRMRGQYPPQSKREPVQSSNDLIGISPQPPEPTPRKLFQLPWSGEATNSLPPPATVPKAQGNSEPKPNEGASGKSK